MFTILLEGHRADTGGLLSNQCKSLNETGHCCAGMRRVRTQQVARALYSVLVYSSIPVQLLCNPTPTYYGLVHETKSLIS